VDEQPTVDDIRRMQAHLAEQRADLASSRDRLADVDLLTPEMLTGVDARSRRLREVAGTAQQAVILVEDDIDIVDTAIAALDRVAEMLEAGRHDEAEALVPNLRALIEQISGGPKALGPPD
jgi:hypothetical protein